jgi:hypothetical protein
MGRRGRLTNRRAVSRFLRSTLLMAAAGTAALACYIGATLPPRTVNLGGSLPLETVFGAYHIHTTRSDGSGTPDDVAAAAARAGLAFILLADHGDGTRTPDPPAYRHGVLCVDGVEINTLAGHLVALGLKTAAPYPLAGEAGDVIEDVHRLGGWTVVAHPDSPTPSLRWRDWAVPYDGVEWLNADSEWRDKHASSLAGTALRALVRPPEAIATLFSRPTRTLQRWDGVNQMRPVVALAAVDAHARLPWPGSDEPRPRTLLARPSYETMFRTLTQGVILDAPFSGDAASDATRLLAALEAGRTFSIVRAFAGPAALEFVATQAGQTVPMGGRLPDMSPVHFHVAVPQAPGVEITLVQGTRRVAGGKGSVEFNGAPSPGAYRVEVRVPGAEVPWILSNAIYADLPAPNSASTTVPVVPALTMPLGADRGWRAEHDAASTGEVTAGPQDVGLTFALGGGPSAGQYAAVVSDVDGQDAFDGVRFTARADRPMRVSLQVRLLSGQRWRRSVYVDGTARAVGVHLDEFQPVETASVLRPNAARIRSVLFVIDTLNTAPGTRGTLTVSNVALSRAPTVDPIK